jgi:hypothetical protein
MAEQSLRRLEEEHKVLVTEFVDQSRARFPDRRSMPPLSNEEFFRKVVQEVQRIAATANTPTIANIEERTFECTFVRLGYTLECAADALLTGRLIERNDYEDALLCQHVDLATDVVLVSADRRLLGSVSRAEKRYREHAAEHRIPNRSRSFSMSHQDFNRLIGN